MFAFCIVNKRAFSATKKFALKAQAIKSYTLGKSSQHVFIPNTSKPKLPGRTEANFAIAKAAPVVDVEAVLAEAADI